MFTMYLIILALTATVVGLVYLETRIFKKLDAETASIQKSLNFFFSNEDKIEKSSKKTVAFRSKNFKKK